MSTTNTVTFVDRRQTNLQKSGPMPTLDVVNDTKVEPFVVPNFTTKDILSVIPSHCFERSFFRSSLYLLQDVVVIGTLAWLANTYIPWLNPSNITLPHPALYRSVRFLAWAAYGFAAGLPGMGLFCIGHECGHGAYSANQTANDVVGFIVHSSIGVPYFSWKISHKLHHASTSHLTKDQPFVPYTRQEWGLPPLHSEKENLEGTRVDPALQEALAEVLEYSPLMSGVSLAGQLLIGWWAYLLADVKGQRNHPMMTNHFLPSSPIFKPEQAKLIVASTVGVGLWFAALAYAIGTFGFLPVFRTYLVPYAWTAHWLVFITYLHHTDPSLPHYDASSFTFARGALATLDRELMGGPTALGKVSNRICSQLTHAICETHVVHHACSRIPHYHAWAAKAKVDELLERHGMCGQGNPATWGEAFRILRECKFIEDEGSVRFYKNAKGKAARVAVFRSDDARSDSAVDL